MHEAGTVPIESVDSERRNATAAVLDRLTSTLMEAQRTVQAKYQQSKSESVCSKSSVSSQGDSPVLAQLEGSRRLVVETVRQLQEALRKELPAEYKRANLVLSAIHKCAMLKCLPPVALHLVLATVLSSHAV